MSRTLSDFQRSEYDRFRQLLQSEWRVDEATLNLLEPSLKEVHKRYLSLACTATVVGHRARRNEYAAGIVETGHLCLVLAVKGLENPSCVLIRQSIELALKHIYFSTHAVEYNWALTREDYKDLMFQPLLDYLRRTEECRELAHGAIMCDRLNFWYGTLSRHVHVHSKGFMGYKSVGSGYRPAVECLKHVSSRTKETWPILTTFLILHNPRRFHSASDLERRLIKSALGKKYKEIVDQA